VFGQLHDDALKGQPEELDLAA
jgi:hypothetical protein